MEAIKIYVDKSMDGYSFSILPSVRKLIKSILPNASPAKGIFVAYDIQSDFEKNVGRLENFLYPALIGIDNQAELTNKVEIQFLDPQTDNVLATVKP